MAILCLEYSHVSYCLISWQRKILLSLPQISNAVRNTTRVIPVFEWRGYIGCPSDFFFGEHFDTVGGCVIYVIAIQLHDSTGILRVAYFINSARYATYCIAVSP